MVWVSGLPYALIESLFADWLTIIDKPITDDSSKAGEIPFVDVLDRDDRTSLFRKHAECIQNFGSVDL